MSATATKWAKRQKIEDRTLSSILGALAACADECGRCEVTQVKLAKSLRMTSRTVERSMPVLEDLELFSRSRQHASQKRGRAADLITLSLDRDFTLTKEKIMGVKRMGPNRQNVGKNAWDQTDKMSGGPKSENDASLYIARARSVISPVSPSNPLLPLRVSTRVRYDRARQSWRASITVNDVTMELGRFNTEAEARAYGNQQEADVRRTWTAKAGTPSFPVVSPSKANLDAPSLGAWLFGDEADQPSDDGSGEADAPGQGTTFLAGVWGEQPHEEATEQESARAREGANDDIPSTAGGNVRSSKGSPT